MKTPVDGPYLHPTYVSAGRELQSASAAVILLHGRGATAESILELGPYLGKNPDFAYLAPQASGNTWYPYSFLAPLDDNEPHLSSGLGAIDRIVNIVTNAGIPFEKIVFAGFSQGGCLASEYVARNARRYGGLLVFSGGLVGPDEAPRDYPGSLVGTPVFLGCSDRDPHIPLQRVDETAKVFKRLAGSVVKKIYPGMGHTIIQDEIDEATNILMSLGIDD